MSDKNIVKCAEDDPNRCKGSTKFGQCTHVATSSLGLCPIHASGHKKFDDRKRAETYQLTKWRANLNRMVDDAGIKSLREEIGLLRMVLETLINQCHEESDLIVHASQIGDLISKVEHVVLSCNRLEKQTGMMLDKSAALQIAGNVVSIIGEHVSDPDVIEKIADEIIEKILNIEYIEDDKSQ